VIQTSPRSSALRDVVFLVADSGIEQMVRGFLGRERFHQSLRCGPFAFDPATDVVVATQGRDPDVHKNARERLRAYEAQYAHAVVILDEQWEGSPGAAKIRDDIAKQMAPYWERFAVVVIEPELEAWVWQDSPHVAQAFKCPPDFRAILANSGHWPLTATKPLDPKAALEYLRDRHRARVLNAAFGRLATQISVRRCEDAAFHHLCENLRTWFPETP
jgi:hypothetical protein